MIAHTIQTSLTPVFLLVAIGNILNILGTRLGRIVDRMYAMRERHGASDDPVIAAQMRALDTRIRLNNRAHFALVIAALAVGLTVSILFVGEMIGHPLEQEAGVAFLIASALLMWGLTLFLREVRIASATTLRLPVEMRLDQDSDGDSSPSR